MWFHQRGITFVHIVAGITTLGLLVSIAIELLK